MRQLILKTLKYYILQMLYEVGMFANKLSELCLENNLDVSYTKCFSSKSKDWIETLYL